MGLFPILCWLAPEHLREQVRDVFGEHRMAVALVQALCLVAPDERLQRGLQLLIGDLLVEAAFHGATVP